MITDVPDVIPVAVCLIGIRPVWAVITGIPDTIRILIFLPRVCHAMAMIVDTKHPITVKS